MIPRELSLQVARLFVWRPEMDDRRPEDVPLDPEACLWYLRIPQSGAALLETWEESCRIVSSLRWISSPFLETDQAGSPELTLAIAPSERRAALCCVSIIRSETGLTVLTDVDVNAWQAATRNAQRAKARFDADTEAHRKGHKTGGVQ